MKMPDPTPAAMRAAEKIVDNSYTKFSPPSLRDDFVRGYARIIDEATGLPALIEACEKGLSSIPVENVRQLGAKGRASLALGHVFAAALAKAKEADDA